MYRIISQLVSLCSPDWSKTCYTDQAGFELTQICLPLPPKTETEGMCHHARLYHLVLIQGLIVWYDTIPVDVNKHLLTPDRELMKDQSNMH